MAQGSQDRKKPIGSLPDGTEVAIANCVGHGRVVRRIRPNCYLIAHGGREIEVARAQLAIQVGAVWKPASSPAARAELAKVAP